MQLEKFRMKIVKWRNKRKEKEIKDVRLEGSAGANEKAWQI